MEANVGETDRLVRIGVGSMLIAVGTILGLAIELSGVALLVGLAGVALLLSGVACRCSVYALLGKNTKK